MAKAVDLSKDSVERKEIIDNASKEAEIITDGAIDNMAKVTGDELKKSDKVTIKIPIDKQNPKDLIVPVAINGYIYQIKRGEKVQVPEAVESILEEAGYI